MSGNARPFSLWGTNAWIVFEGQSIVFEGQSIAPSAARLFHL